MGYIIFYEVTIVALTRIRGKLILEIKNYDVEICVGRICKVDVTKNKLLIKTSFL